MNTWHFTRKLRSRRYPAMFVFFVMMLSLVKFITRHLNVSASISVHPVVKASLDGGIPHRIHQYFSKGWDIPEVFVPWIASWINNHPDWEYWIWTDKDVEQLIQDHLGEDTRYLEIYRGLPSFYYRTDLARYIILYIYGGVYADLDNESLKPLDDWVLNRECLLIHQEWYDPVLLKRYGDAEVVLINSLMAAKPKSPFLKALVDEMYDNNCTRKVPAWNLVGRSLQIEAPFCTGPQYLTNVYKKFTQQSHVSYNITTVKNITTVTPEYFNPIYPKAKVKAKRKLIDVTCQSSRLTSIQKRLCHRFYHTKNEPTRLAYVVHHGTNARAWQTIHQRFFSHYVNIANIIPQDNLYSYNALKPTSSLLLDRTSTAVSAISSFIVS